jgi:hypothetical protein
MEVLMSHGKSRKRKRKTRSAEEYPIAIVVKYGPDDRTVTKMVATVIRWPGDEAGEMRRWVGTKVASDPGVAAKMDEFLRSHGVKKKLSTPVVFGCPHEEGEDFPEGGDCPFCPFWKGKQGSGAVVEERWASLTHFKAEYIRYDRPPGGGAADGP